MGSMIDASSLFFSFLFDLSCLKSRQHQHSFFFFLLFTSFHFVYGHVLSFLRTYPLESLGVGLGLVWVIVMSSRFIISFL